MSTTSSNDLFSLIKRYQYSIQQAQSAGTNDKILRYIHKLSKLPIKLKELEKTGVGKTINSLRKCSGAVGEEANLLVAKWKLICTKEMEEKESVDKCSVDHSQSDYDSPNGHCEVGAEAEDEASAIAKSDRSHPKKKSRSNEMSKSKIHLITIKKDDRKRKHSNEVKDKQVKKEKYRKLSDEAQSSFTVERNVVPQICENDQLPENNESEQSGDLDQTHQMNKHKKKEKENEIKSHKKDHEKRHHKSSKHSTHRDGSSKQHRRHSKSSHHDKKDDSENTSSQKHKEKEIKKFSDSKDEKKSKSKISSDSSGDCGGVSDGFVSENNERCDDDFGAALMGIPTATSPKKRSPSSKSSTRRDKMSPTSSSSPKRNDNIDSLLSNKVKLEPLSRDLDMFDGSYSFNDDISRETKIKHEFKDDAISPNNYSPREKFSKPKLLSEEEMFSCMTSTKNQRTKVFSGLKTSATHFKFPTLFELCVRVLQDNFNALEYTGGIPYDLLKPILEKVTADQLFSFENYNPYLIGETDELWQFHANKHFRKAKLQENESWRDLYLRCVDERQEKLQSLTENISQAMANSAPVRKTKLAYLDTHVKPPRNVARIQQKHGTSNAIIPKKSKDKQLSPTAIQSVKERLAKDVCSPNAIQIPTKSLIAPKKKAPLMQKTLRLFKGLNKR